MSLQLAVVLVCQITKTPVLDAGEEITRKLAFGYPEGVLPDRLICFGNEIPLQHK